jgi:pseudouridine synthase
LRRAAASVSLARALSKLGVCSRREAVRWIAAGRVSVDGRTERDAARRLDPRLSRVRVDGRRVREPARAVVIALHKPAGLLTTRADPAGRPTVYSLLAGVGAWVFPVGRLDKDTRGLLVLTNDHRLGQHLTDPGRHVPKTYHARIRGTPDAAALEALRQGVCLGDGEPTRPARVRSLGTARDGASWLEMVLTEGRNRQVRRMLRAVGHDVLDLVRVRIGELGLEGLPPGRWRRLDAGETALLSGGGRRPGPPQGEGISAPALPGPAGRPVRSWSRYWSW